MIEAEWWEYDSIDELAEAVAGDIRFIIESAIDARGSSLIAVPCGTTGPAIFPKLVGEKLPWKKVTVIPTDDRVVPVDNALSNAREIARAFLPAGARVIPIVSGTAEDYRLAGNAGRCPASGSPLAARSGLARHGQGWPHRLDLCRQRLSGCA